jgi:hypothetical protein
MDKLDTLFWLLCTNYMLIIVLIGTVGYKIDKLETRIRELEKKPDEKDM